MTNVTEGNPLHAQYARQLGIYNPADRENDAVTFIGVGGIGSFAAFGAAKLGVPKLTLIDPDIVEVHNQPNQFYGIGDIGSPKVEAMEGHIISDRDYHGVVETYQEKLPVEDGSFNLSGLVVSGLDSMEARSSIWESCIKLKPRVTHYIDARLSGQNIVLYTVNPTSYADCEKYEKLTLNYTDEEAEETLCTERGIIDVGMQVGSLITRLIRMHFNGEELPSVTLFNQATYTSTVGDWWE